MPDEELNQDIIDAIYANQAAGVGFSTDSPEAQYVLNNPLTPPPIDNGDISNISVDGATNTLNDLNEQLTQIGNIQQPVTPITTEEQSQGFNLTFQEALEVNGGNFEGWQQNSDGTFTAISSFALSNIGITGLISNSEQEIDAVTGEIENLISNFNSYNILNDPAYQIEAQNIRNTYSEMTRNMEIVNNSRKQAYKTMGYRTGSAQYANAVISGIIGEEIKQGSARIAEIARSESQAISDAKTAFENRKYTKFAIKMENLKTLRETKQDELRRYNEKLVEANQAIKAANEFEMEVLKYELDLYKSTNTDFMKEFSAAKLSGFQGNEFDYRLALQEIDNYGKETGMSPIVKTTRDMAVLGLYNQGVTDVATMMKYLNYDNGDFTAEEVMKTLDNITKLNDPINEGKTMEISNPDGTTSLVEKDPNTGMWNTIWSNVDNYGGQSIGEDALNWTKNVRDGLRKFSDVPNELKTEVNNITATLPPSQKTLDEAQRMIDQIKALKEHKGLDQAVGPRFTGLITRNWIGIGSRDAFLGQANKLVSQLALNKLIKSKQEGATFGALSDREMDILKAAATALGTWEMLSKNGKVKGYKVNEKAFKAELDQLINDYQRIVDEGRGMLNVGANESPEQKIIDYGSTHPSEREVINKMLNPNIPEGINPYTNKPWTNEEILQTLKIPLSNANLKQTNVMGTSYKDPSSIKIGAGLAVANNNPGNLRYVGQIGASQGKGGFAKFNSPIEGWRALIKDLQGKQTGNTRTGLTSKSTLKDLIYKYAPPSENASATYVKQIANWLSINPNTPIGQINTYELARAIAKKESSTIIT